MTAPAIPPAIGYGTVSWTVTGFSPDTILDPDQFPDAEVITGKVHLKPSPPWLKTVPGAAEPMTILPKPQTYDVINGRMVDRNGNPSVVLVADGPGTNPVGWTYEATYELDGGYGFGTFSFHLDVDEHVDLTEVSPVQSSEGVFYIVGPPGPKGDPGDTGDAAALDMHINDTDPHPAYDDSPSLTLYLENGMA